LDERHQSHNIPGKFLTYLSAGLPVLAQVNLNNDLIQIIDKYSVGQVNSSNSELELLVKADLLIKQIKGDKKGSQSSAMIYRASFFNSCGGRSNYCRII